MSGRPTLTPYNTKGVGVTQTGTGNGMTWNPSGIPTGNIPQAIQQQPPPADLSAYYAQMTKALQDALSGQQNLYQQMLGSQQQYNNLIDPNITNKYYDQLNALQKQLQAQFDPNMGLAEHNAMMQAMQPVQQRSRAFTLAGY